MKEFLSPSKRKQKRNFCNSKKVTLLGLGIDYYRFASRLNLRLIARLIAPIDKWPRPQGTASHRRWLQTLHFISCLLFNGLHLSVSNGISVLPLRPGSGVTRLWKGQSLIWGSNPAQTRSCPHTAQVCSLPEQRSSKLALKPFACW